MPSDGDLRFLRAAVERGALDLAAAAEVRDALEQVEALGATSSAREIAVNRGVLTREQADRIAAGGGATAKGRASQAPRRTREEADPPTPIRRRRQLGNFKIIEKLGRGGMGVVYKARQLSMDRLVAVKVLPRRLARDRSFIERFLREARSAARLNHPNIVQGIDVGEADGLYYFAMELVEGESLKARLLREGRISQAEALQIARQVALALEHANSHNIIHRDIKPDNILLTRTGTAKLADLGLAKRQTDVAVTQHAGPIGTPLYMSPEQARGKGGVDTRSDLYSLGVTLYHAVVGSPPFTGASAAAIITQHLFEKPPSPKAAVPELTDGFCAVLLKMLAKRPADRYQSPTELLEDIQRLLNGRPPIRASRPASRTAPRGTSTALHRARRRRRASPIIPIFATTAIVFLGITVWLVYSALAGASEEPVVARPTPQPREAYTARQRPPQAARGPRPRPPTQAPEALQAARRWAQEHPDEPAAAAARFHALAKRYPKTAAAQAALDEARRLEMRQREEADRPFRDVCGQARQLAAQHHFAEAVELLDTFGADHREFMDRVAEARGGILSQALATDRSMRSQASALAKAGDFPGAIALYEQIVGFGIPKLTARAKHEIRVLSDKQAAARREAKRAAEEAFLALRLRWAPMLEARQLDAVRAELKTALSDPALAPVRDALEAEARDLAVAASVWAAAERGARGLERNESFSVGGIHGRFVEYADGAVTVLASGVPCRKPLRELTTKEVLTLALRELPAGEAQTHIAAGLFLLAEGRLRDAGRAFAKAEAAGGDASRYRALIGRRQADAVEAEAEALFARIGELRAAGQWEQAGKALRTYQEKYAKTRSRARRRASLDELALEIRLATLDVTDLFHGACRRTGNGRRVEVVYDLSDPAQLADWELRGADWSLREGCLALTGARALWRAPIDGDGQISLDLADATGPPGLWGITLAEAPDARPHYGLALPERPGLQAALRYQQREMERAPAAFRVGQPRRVAFGLRGRRLRATLDGEDLVRWTDDAPKAPPLLYLALGAAPDRTIHARSLRVAATVGEQWVADELERLRLRLRKEHQLAQQPWQSLFNGSTVAPWRAEHGNWRVEDGALVTDFGGSLALDGEDIEDFALRLALRPLRANSVVRVSFRAARSGERYGLVVGCRREDCALVLERRARSRGGGTLARFGERVALEPGQWYDLHIVAIGSSFRAELGDVVLCLVRDDRRHGGSLSLDVLHGGAALKNITCRRLRRAGSEQP